VVIDNLSKGFRRNVNPKAAFYKADITNLALMEKIFKKEKPEAVNHHAAIAEVSRSMRDPIPTLTTNVLGTANVLLAFGHHGRGGAKRKFIFSSTGGAMYGDPKRIPVDETTLPTRSRHTDYQKTCRGNDPFLRRTVRFQLLHLPLCKRVRPTTKPARRSRHRRDLRRTHARRQSANHLCDGTKARDYVYVSDVAAANLAALKKGKDVTVNIGRGIATSDKEMFEAIARAAGFEKKPVYAPYREGEIYRISLNAKKAQKLLSWKPKIAIDDGVQMALKDILKN